MRRLFFVVVLIAVSVMHVAAQVRPDMSWEGRKYKPGVISIFSEDNSQFYVVINGIRQNTSPQSMIRIENVPTPLCNVQILFADNRTPEIQSRIMLSNPVNEEHDAINLIMALKRSREGNFCRLEFFRSQPREHNYAPAQGEYVMIFGQDGSGGYNNNNGYSNNGGGYTNNANNMQNNGYNNQNNGGFVAPPVPPAPSAMDNPTFQSAKQTIINAKFEDTRLSTAKTIAGNNYFTVDQVIEICKLFSFEDTKLDFAKFVFPRTVDNKNYFRVGNVLSFDSNRQALNDFIQSQK
jgi:Domain of unknown function (DUF4476)